MQQDVYVSLQHGFGTPRVVHFAPGTPAELTVGPKGTWRVTPMIHVGESPSTSARLSFDGARLFVRVGPGEAATWVNGVAVTEDTALPPRCQLSIAGVLFRCDTAAPANGACEEAHALTRPHTDADVSPVFSVVPSLATTLLGFRTLDAMLVPPTAPESTGGSFPSGPTPECDEGAYPRTRALSLEEMALAQTRPEAGTRQLPGQAFATRENPAYLTASVPSSAATNDKVSVAARTVPKRVLALALTSFGAAGVLVWGATRWLGTTSSSSNVEIQPTSSLTADEQPRAELAAAGEAPHGVPSQAPQPAASGEPQELSAVVPNAPSSHAGSLAALEARAVEALASGQRELAVGLYDELAREAPAFTLYAEVSRMLRDNPSGTASER